jgi:hypothetical protein
MIHKEHPMASKDKQQKPQQGEHDDDVKKGPGTGRDPQIENPGRGDEQQEVPSEGDQDEQDEPEK